MDLELRDEANDDATSPNPQNQEFMDPSMMLAVARPTASGPHTLSEALRAILYPNETAQALFRRARTKPFRTGLAVFDMAEQFLYGGPPSSSSSTSSTSSTSTSSTSSSSTRAQERGGPKPAGASGGAASGQAEEAAAGQAQQQRGVRGGDVVEFCGKAGSGKTELLLQVVASAILPPVWRYRVGKQAATGTDAAAVERRLELNGEGVGVVFFDNDLKFNVLRLERLLRARIRSAVARQAQQEREQRPSRADDNAEAVRRKRPRVSDANERQEQHWTSEREDELVEECLGRLIVHRCEDSLQFLTTLQLTDELIRNMALPSGAPKNEEDNRAGQGSALEIKMIVIDSIGAFHNADKNAEVGFGFGFGGNKRGGGSRSRMPKIVHTLKQLVNQHNLIVFAAKGAPYGKLTRQTVLNPSADPHQEFLGDAWQNFVKYRLLLVREEEELGGRPSFWACINKPSLTLSLPSAAQGRAGAVPGAVTRVRTKLFPFLMSEEGVRFSESEADRHRAT